MGNYAIHETVHLNLFEILTSVLRKTNAVMAILFIYRICLACMEFVMKYELDLKHDLDLCWVLLLISINILPKLFKCLKVLFLMFFLIVTDLNIYSSKSSKFFSNVRTLGSHSDVSTDVYATD